MSNLFKKLIDSFQTQSIKRQVTDAYSDFGDYIDDQPIKVFHNGEVIGEVEKEINIVESEQQTRILIRYNPLDVESIADSHDIDVKTVIFNGSDIVINGRKNKTVYLPLYVEIIVYIDDAREFSIEVEKMLPIRDSRLSAIMHDINHQEIVDKCIKESNLISQHSALAEVEIERSEFADNKLVVHMGVNPTRSTPVYVNDKLVATHDTPLMYDVEDGTTFTVREAENAKYSALALVRDNDLLPKFYYPIGVEEDIVKGQYVFRVETDLDKLQFDPIMIDTLYRFVNHVEQDGPENKELRHQIEEFLVFDKMNSVEAEGETDVN